MHYSSRCIHSLFFSLASSLLPSLSSHFPLFSPSLLCTLYPSFIASLSPSSHSRTSFFLPLSSPEGMSKCMVEWRREVGLALPNSISEKLELREACLHQRANAGLLLQFHKQCGRARYAEIDVNPKTNKYTKGKQTSNVLPTLTPFNPEPCNETYSKMSEWEFPRPCKSYISVKTHKCTGTHVYLADPLFPLWVRSNGGSANTNMHTLT